jgi:hypothetical protein
MLDGVHSSVMHSIDLRHVSLSNSRQNRRQKQAWRLSGKLTVTSNIIQITRCKMFMRVDYMFALRVVLFDAFLLDIFAFISGLRGNKCELVAFRLALLVTPLDVIVPKFSFRPTSNSITMRAAIIIAALCALVCVVAVEAVS